MSGVLLPGVFSVNADTVAHTGHHALLPPPMSWAGSADGGNYHLDGSAAIDGTPDIPVHRRVLLFCARSGRLVREMWSDPVTGAYRFEHVRIGPWLVIAQDYTGTYNAVVADNILGQPE